MTRDYLAWVGEVLEEVSTALRGVSADQVAACKRAVLSARRVFLGGKGRSGWIMRAAAIRMMHLGLSVHVIDEPTTPSITPGDLLLLASGSGRTPSVVHWAEKARALGAEVAIITAQPDAPAAQAADILVHIPAPSKDQAGARHASAQPMANGFEQSLLLLMDILAIQLMPELGQDEASMFARHANLE
jgi:6-phospho-3-hexuloisomerase